MTINTTLTDLGYLTSIPNVSRSGISATITTTSGAVGGVSTAALPTGVTGTFQWTRENGAGVISNIAGAVSQDGVNSHSYTQVVEDIGCIIGCNVSSIASSAVGSAVTAGLPGAPTIGTATSGDGTISVTFTAPVSDGGSAIIGYKATLSDGSVATGVSSPIGFTGLPNGVARTAVVQALNAIGYGPASAPSNSVTPELIISSLNSATLLGDSKIQLGNPSATGETSPSHIGWANDILRQTGPGIDAVYLRAVGGVTLQTIQSTQLPLALADDTAIAWLHGGVNSFNDGISGGPFTLAQNIAVAQAIITSLAGAKTAVIVDSIDPVSQSGSTGAKPRWAEFQPFNAAIRAHCATFSNVLFNDTFSALVDPASAFNNPATGMVRTDDGIHNTTLGAQTAGYASAIAIASFLNLTKYKTAGANLIPGISSTGGTSTPGSGTITGGANIPAGWNLQVVSGIMQVTVSQPVAGTVRLFCKNTATGTPSTVYLQVAPTAALLAALTSGQTVQAGFDFAMVGTSVKLTRVACTIRYNGSIVWDAMQRDATSAEPNAVLVFPQAVFSGRRLTHPSVVPGSLTSAEFLISLNLDIPSTGTATIDISNPVFNVLS